MPGGFAERFRLHDGNYLETLLTEISIEDIPSTLGGNNKVGRDHSAVGGIPRNCPLKMLRKRY